MLVSGWAFDRIVKSTIRRIASSRKQSIRSGEGALKQKEFIKLF